MKEEDKAHIQLICDRNNIRWLNDAESLMYNLMHKNYDLIKTGSSYSSQLIDRNTGEPRLKAIYINPKDAEEFELDSTPELDEENEYFVALHELGHSILGHHSYNHTDQTELPHEQIEENEMAAWEWAFSHANYWPSDETIVRSLCALSTYTHAEQWERMRERDTLDELLERLAA